jgi:hypothetical protein
VYNQLLLSLGAPDCPVVHRTVSGAPGRAQANWPLSGIRRRCTTIIHRTVRWCTGLSGGALDCPVNQWPPAQRSAVQSAHDAWPQPTVGCAILGRRSAPDNEQWMSGGPANYPVRHLKEGKNCLLGMTPTAPSCLGAIKGTPRRMEE